MLLPPRQGPALEGPCGNWGVKVYFSFRNNYMVYLETISLFSLSMRYVSQPFLVTVQDDWSQSGLVSLVSLLSDVMLLVLA